MLVHAPYVSPTTAVSRRCRQPQQRVRKIKNVERVCDPSNGWAVGVIASASEVNYSIEAGWGTHAL